MELLHSLRILCEYHRRSQLHIPALDRLLNIFTQPSRASQQPPEQDTHTPQQYGPEGAHAPPAKAKPAVIEITGTSPFSGKTHLLYYITAVAILPTELNGVFLNGKGGAVVVLDTDSRFDVPRLKQVMKYFIRARYLEVGALFIDEDGLEDLMRHALLHVHIYRPQSPASLVATLEAIPSYLLYSAKEHFSSGRALEAVLLDSVSAFIYQDRGIESTDSNPNCNPGNPFAKRYQDIVRGLRALQQTFKCVIVATAWGLFPCHSERQIYTKKPPPPSFRPHLPAVWTSFCTLRLIVTRDAVAKFGPGMSAEEALKDTAARQEVVDRGGFSGWVDQGWGSDEWSEETREALKRVKGGGFFWFRIVEDGVVIED
ncbi:hypothetical protein FGG08_004481 [Glutinoglossum americanum]|uniref:DNA recombination and repair protein Rad51-like C-terminal domain-containing protein n=1 Tax=Glutinoglossum americanum TaxID=1670608 RepID=A0A9P8L2G6_9PEZI|nr:hypothetical protein FGG08_004481 [Glutinoglossum americanum]